MAKLVWDATGEKQYESGVDHGVLYLRNSTGEYNNGVVWNGLTAVTESPSGAESNPQYADNIKYLNLVSAEEFSATVEAYTYPDEFAECDGSVEIVDGVIIGQQARKTFGLSYRTKVGNDVAGQDAGYKLHLVWGALAAPSEKAYSTINDSPEAITFSWELSTTPVSVTGLKPTASITLNSLKADSEKLADLEAILYGSDEGSGVAPRLPSPDEVIQLLGGTFATATAPSRTGNTVTIPTVTGVVYSINGTPVTGSVTITENTTVTAAAAEGYALTPGTNSWTYPFTP